MRSASSNKSKVAFLCAAVAALTSACTASAPRNIENGCAIFYEKRGWHRAASRSASRWGTPIHVQLAIIHQESKFQAKARPPRRKFLFFFPGRRPSSAYGYAQALDTTWREYIKDSGNRGADRHKFHDAVDFVGWYTARSSKRSGIAKTDAYRLYLAYHEGDGGYRRRTYERKSWLKRVARKVAARASAYRTQLASCK